jgi:hypothetical protein
VTFTGWSAAAVRSVIGESGSGWCLLEEETGREDEDDALSEVLSEMSGAVDDYSVEACNTTGTDPSQSMVLPKLDFSASFPSQPPSSLAPSSRSMSLESISDVYETASHFSSDSGWVGFSSEFLQRVRDVEVNAS